MLIYTYYIRFRDNPPLAIITEVKSKFKSTKKAQANDYGKNIIFKITHQASHIRRIQSIFKLIELLRLNYTRLLQTIF